MDATVTEFDVGALALVFYLYNTSGTQYAEDVFPGEHPNYLEEKAGMWARSPSRAIGFLDSEHLRRLFAIARERYEAQARKQLAF